MKTAIHCAIQTLLDNNIHSLPILSSDIEKIIQKQCFEIISYNVPLSGRDINEFDSLGLSETANSFKAFTYVDNDYKYVFYRSNLSAQERTRLLAHELGYICLGHFSQSGLRCSFELENKSPQEIEADEFALELLAPTCILKKMRGLTPEKISHITLMDQKDAEHIFFRIKNHTTNTDEERSFCNIYNLFNKTRPTVRYTLLAILLTAAIISCVFWIWANDSKQTDNDASISPTATPIIQMQQDQPATSSVAESIDSTVVVTRTGRKYHNPDCRHIIGRNVFKLTVLEAIDKGYEPCEDCF